MDPVRPILGMQGSSYRRNVCFGDTEWRPRHGDPHAGGAEVLREADSPIEKTFVFVLAAWAWGMGFRSLPIPGSGKVPEKFGFVGG